MDKTRNSYYMQRINWIDWAKALGILLVVMGHSNYAQDDINPMIFMIHMPLFFVVSGYLFKTDKGLKAITQSNIRTLLIPYILFNAIWMAYILVTAVAKQFLGLDPEWSSFVDTLYQTVVGVPGNLFCGTSWFLLALIWCKYILYAFERGGHLWEKMVVAFLWMVAFVMIQIYQPKSPLCFNAGVTGCLWFCIGYNLKKYSEKMHVAKWMWVIAIPVAFVGCLYVCRLQGNCNYLVGNVKGLLGLAGTAAGLVSFFGVCILLDKWNSKLIMRISSASIVIMCLHMMVMINLQKAVHYQYHLGITLIGDVTIVLILAAVFPLMQKYTPWLIGYRK